MTRTDGRMVTTALLVAFVVLKSTGLIDWPWWVVLAPFWVPLLVAAPVLLALVVRSKRRDSHG